MKAKPQSPAGSLYSNAKGSAKDTLLASLSGSSGKKEWITAAKKEEVKFSINLSLNILTPKEIYAPNTLPAMVENPAVMIAWSSDLVMCGKYGRTSSGDSVWKQSKIRLNVPF